MNNKLYNLLSEYNDSFNNVIDKKYFDNFKKEFKQNLMVRDGKATKANHFETLGQHFALINAIKIDPEWNDQAARKKLLTFINNHDLNSEDAKKARRQLSSILFD